nr:MFS transporter [Fodinicola feengrottensis]
MLAGALLQHFWWGSVFLVAVPVMVALLVAGPFLLPEFSNPTGNRVDLASAGLSLAAVLLLVYGLKQLTVGDSHNPVVPLLSIAAGVVVAVAFVRRQLVLETPLLDLRLFANRAFTAVLISLVFAGVAMAGTGLLVTQYLQSVLGFTPLESALLFAPMGIGVAVGTMLAPALTRRMLPSTAIAGGLLISVLGCVLLTQVSATGGLPVAIAAVTVLALGTGPLFALGTGLVIGSVRPERAGSAAAMSETSNYFGGAFGIALLGAISAAVYRTQLAGFTGVPAAARETLAGAQAASAHLPAAQAYQLLQTAKDAFTSGVTICGIIAAVIFAALAVVVVRTGQRAETAAPESENAAQTAAPVAS